MKKIADGNQHSQHQLSDHLDMIQEVDQNEEKTVKSSGLAYASLVSQVQNSKLCKSDIKEKNDINKIANYQFLTNNEETLIRKINSESDLQNQATEQSIKQQQEKLKNDMNICFSDILENKHNDKERDINQFQSNKVYCQNHNEIEDIQEKPEIDEQIVQQDISEQSSNTFQYIYDDENSNDSFIDEKVKEFRQTNIYEENYQNEDNEYQQQILSTTVYLKDRSKELESATFKKVDEEDVEEEDDDSLEGQSQYSYKKRNNYLNVISPDIIQIPSNQFVKKNIENKQNQENLQQQNDQRKISFTIESCSKTPKMNTQMLLDSNVLEEVQRKVSIQQTDQNTVQRQFSFKETQINTETNENQIIENENQQNKEQIQQKPHQISSYRNFLERDEIFSESNQTKQKGILKIKQNNQEIINTNLFLACTGDNQDYKNKGNSPYTCVYKTENLGWEYLSVDGNDNSQKKERVRSEEKNYSPFSHIKLEANNQHSNSLNTTGLFLKSGRSIVHSYKNPLDITEREQQILKSKRFQTQNSQTQKEDIQNHLTNINYNLKQTNTFENYQDQSQQQHQSLIMNYNQNKLNEIQDQNNNQYQKSKDSQIIQQNIVVTQGSTNSLDIQSVRRLSVNNINGTNICLKNNQSTSIINNTDNNNTTSAQLQKQYSGFQKETAITSRNTQNFSESPSIRPRLSQTQNVQDNLLKQIGSKIQNRIQNQLKYPYSEIIVLQNQNKSGIQSVQPPTSTTNQYTSHSHNNSYSNVYTTSGYPSPPSTCIGISSNNSQINYPQFLTNLNSIYNSQNQVQQNYNRQYFNPKPVQSNGVQNKQKQKQFNIQVQQGNGVISQNGTNIKVSSLNSSLVRRGNKRKMISPNANRTNKQSPSFIIQNHKSNNTNQIQNINTSQIVNQTLNQDGKQITNQNLSCYQTNNKGSSQMSPNNQKQFDQHQRNQQIYSLSQQSTITNSNLKYSNKQSNLNNSGDISYNSQQNIVNNSIFSNQQQHLQMLNSSSLHQPSVIMLGATNTLTPINIQKNEMTQLNILGKVIPSSKDTFLFYNQKQQNYNPYLNLNQNQQSSFSGQQQEKQTKTSNQINSPKLYLRSNSRNKCKQNLQQQQDNSSIDVPSLLPAIQPINSINNHQVLSVFSGQEGTASDLQGSFYYKTLNKSSAIYSPKRFSIDYPNVQSSLSSQSNTRQIVKDMLKRQLNNQNNTTHSKINEKLKKTTQIYLGNNTTQIYSGGCNIQNQINSNNQTNLNKTSNSTNMNDSLIGIGNGNNQINNLTQYSYGNENLMSSLSVVGNGCNFYRNNNHNLNHQQQQILVSTNTKTFRGASNDDTQYTLKTLPSAVSLADCQQNITQQLQYSNPQQISSQNNQGFPQYLCHSTRPSRKQNQTKTNSVNQREKAPYNRNSSLFENSHGSLSNISTFNNQNNCIVINSQNNNSNITKNNLQSLVLDNNSKQTLKKYIRASSELRKRPIRQINSIHSKANNCNKNNQIDNNTSNTNQNAQISIYGITASTNQNEYITKPFYGQSVNNQFNNYYTNNNGDFLQGNQIKMTRSIQETPQKKNKVKLLYERVNSQPDEISYENQQ